MKQRYMLFEPEEMNSLQQGWQRGKLNSRPYFGMGVFCFKNKYLSSKAQEPVQQRTNCAPLMWGGSTLPHDVAILVELPILF